MPRLASHQVALPGSIRATSRRRSRPSPVRAGSNRAGPWVVGAVAKLLVEGGMLVVEHDRREALPESAGVLFKVDQRRFGDTVLSFYRAALSDS